jgi:hypothetical protein
MLIALNQTCHVLNTPPFNTTSYEKVAVKQCYTNLFWLGVAVFVIGIAVTIAVIMATGDLLLGTVLYIISFVIGFGLLFL